MDRLTSRLFASRPLNSNDLCSAHGVQSLQKETKMKKLLILAAALVAGVAANAASFRWQATNIYGSDGATKWSGLVTLFASGGTLDKVTEVATFTPTSAGFVNTTFNKDSLVDGNSYEFYFVIEDSGKTFTSATKVVSAQANSTQNIIFGSMASATQNADNWATVPEPTSGLLVLLGMAGLALKRKRA